MRRLLLAMGLVTLLAGCGNKAALSALGVPHEVIEVPVYSNRYSELRIPIRNLSRTPLLIQDVDLHSSLLAGAQVWDCNPRPRRATQELRQWRIFNVNLTVPANSEAAVVFTLSSADDFTHHGRADVCLDNFRCISVPITLVGTKGEAKAPAQSEATAAPGLNLGEPGTAAPATASAPTTTAPATVSEPSTAPTAETAAAAAPATQPEPAAAAPVSPAAQPAPAATAPASPQ